MTDRAQPGAIDSVIRNDELAQVFDKFTDGFVIPATDPTAAAQRRPDIDETALDEFRLSGVSGGSLTVTVEPGEAFIGGWMCRDTSTTVSLPANDTARIVAGYSTNAIFDPQVDADRDDADKAFIQLQRNTDPEFPQSVIHRVTTDGSGVTGDERVAAVGPQVSVNNLIIDSVNSITDATPRPGRVKIARKTDPGGNQIFEFTNATDRIRSSPTVVDGVVYVGSRDSTLYAIDAATGNQIFEFTNASSRIQSSPTVVDGVVYVGSFDNSLYAIDAATGNQIFEFTNATDRIRSSPTVVDGVVYVGSDDSTLYAVDAATREAQLYVGDEFGFIPVHKGPEEDPRIIGSTLTGNTTTDQDLNS
jgi:outer membrane protein assembly factor BamB